jgi:hypothetical protein
MLRFSLALAVLASAILGVLVAGEKFEWFAVPSFSRTIVLFLWLTHIIMYAMVVRQLELRPTDFVKVYLGMTVLRILFFGAFVFLIIRIDRAGAYPNAIVFLVCYFLFTSIEVVALYRVVSNQKPLREGQKEG